MEVAGAPANITCRSVTLNPTLKAGASTTIRSFLVFTHTLVPFPAKITQKDQQLVVFEDYVYIVSPYTLKSAETQVPFFMLCVVRCWVFGGSMCVVLYNGGVLTTLCVMWHHCVYHMYVCHQAPTFTFGIWYIPPPIIILSHQTPRCVSHPAPSPAIPLSNPPPRTKTRSPMVPIQTCRHSHWNPCDCTLSMHSHLQQ